MNSFRSERGQALVLPTLFLVALLGMAALVLDIGSWFREQRDTQRIADAAALAGAQALPEDPAAARGLAIQYTNKNGGGSPQISFRSTRAGVDTIDVTLRRDAPGFFSKLFGVDKVNVGAKASARASNINSARWAAPIGVDEKHPFLAGCKPIACFNQDTELDLEKVGPGAFRLLNLDRSKGGTGQQTLAEWILRGFDGWMPLGDYNSDPGAKFNASEVKAAMQARLNTEMLFPVYRTIREQGANLEYEVIGWVGFFVTGFDAKGNGGVVYGHFTRVIWEGIQNESAGNPDFGVRAIELIE